jgi:fused signal recognition particle receptor
LTTGVDVEARPPGKRVKRLSLLSGGEKSLTAVAMLVAIFKARPSPFYVLDEVEAALDDVNLGRLLGVLEELRESSQLIIITHQKRTMEIADALYGVTMRKLRILPMGLFSKFIAKIKGTNDFSPADWAELEQELLSSDVGPKLAKEFLEAARKVKSDNAEAALIEIMTQNLSKSSHDPIVAQGTTTIMVVGVNGTGKTTSVAKLASHYKRNGKSVVLAAGDTFRAAAVDQLKTWGDRIGVVVVSGKENGDPASVAFDGAQSAKESQSDVFIIDTAGRLHNKSDLMAELSKVKRVVEKVSPINEVLLVIDATTGQNGLQQAKIFTESVDVTGIVLTKLDGSAKGGVALAIEAELGIPIKWIGTGESETDFAPFDAQSYIAGLLS